MPDDIESDSPSQSARAVAASAIRRLLDVKTTGKGPFERFLHWLDEGPKRRGRPLGSKKYDDEPHLIEMGRLLEEGQADTHYGAAKIVVRFRQLAGSATEESVIKRLCLGFKEDEQRYRRLGREKATNDPAGERS